MNAVITQFIMSKNGLKITSIAVIIGIILTTISVQYFTIEKQNLTLKEQEQTISEYETKINTLVETNINNTEEYKRLQSNFDSKQRQWDRLSGLKQTEVNELNKLIKKLQKDIFEKDQASLQMSTEFEKCVVELYETKTFKGDAKDETILRTLNNIGNLGVQ